MDGETHTSYHNSMSWWRTPCDGFVIFWEPFFL